MYKHMQQSSSYQENAKLFWCLENQRNVIYQINTLKKIYMIILIATEKNYKIKYFYEKKAQQTKLN